MLDRKSRDALRIFSTVSGGVIGLLILFIVFTPSNSPVELPVGQECGRGSKYTQNLPAELDLIHLGNRISYRCEEAMKPTGIILHYTATDSFHRTLDVLEKRGLYVHIVLDLDGKAYLVMDSLEERAAGAPGANGWAIHLEIVGDKETLLADALNNGPQSTGVVQLIEQLSEYYTIPRTNHISDPNALIWNGIFSHQQIAEIHPQGLNNGKTDPGEEYMEIILTKLGGEYRK